MKDLREKALLVRLSISAWTARKHDRKVTQETIKNHNAEADAGRFNKLLVAKDALKAITTAKGDAWTFHYSHTAPWGDDGWRIITTKGYMEYSQGINYRKEVFQGHVDDFITAYPTMREAAKIRLNSMYEEKDYPSYIADKFNFEIEFQPIPHGDDFRVNLHKHEVKRIRDLMASKEHERLAASMRDVWGRLHSAVDRIAERMSDTDKIFRDSLIGNVVQLVNILPALNLTDDPDLERLRREVEEKLATQDPAQLREDPVKRKQAHKDATTILAAMESYIGQPPASS